LSTNWRTASRTIWSSSGHSNIAGSYGKVPARSLSDPLADPLADQLADQLAGQLGPAACAPPGIQSGFSRVPNTPMHWDEERVRGRSGMDPGGISVTRTLPIDGALLSEVLLRLRRDSVASALRWTLGDRGTAEVEVSFTSAGSQWTTRARLWNRAGLAVTAATLRVEAVGVDEVRLTVEPMLPTWTEWGDESELVDLTQAALDELAEELLWHATRVSMHVQ
jgi:hypothetical protein